MQGKTTIQLFDAKTKKEVQRVVDKNIITNFYKSLFETCIKNMHMRMFGSSLHTMLSVFSPMEASKGIHLFDTDQTADDDTLLPTGGACIGHAGGDYSASDPYRGDYNVSESGAITGGYRHVWDFATDKANGTTHCVCLTTQKGGDIGYNSNEYQSIMATAPVSDLLTGNDLTSLGFSPTGAHYLYTHLVGVAQPGADLYWQENHYGTIKLHKSNKINFGAIVYSTAPILAYGSYAEKTMGANEYLYLSFIGSTLYGLVYNVSTYALYLRTYDLTLAQLTSVTLGTGHQMSLTSACTWGMVDNTVFIKSSTTDLVDRYNATTGAYIDSLTITGVKYVGQFADYLVWMGKES